MKTSPKGRQFIAAMEGTVLKVYLDPIGLPTVGVGHLLSAAERGVYQVGQRVTKEEVDAWLAQDLGKTERAVEDAVKVKLTQNQFDALVSLTFNIGIGGFRRSTVLKKLNESDYQAAADAFMSWIKAGGKVIPGLQKRRQKERAMFLTPDSTVVPIESPKEASPEPEQAVVPAEPAPIEQPSKPQSIGSKLTAAIATITGFFTMLNLNVGELLSPRLKELSGRTFFFGILAVVCLAVGAWVWDRSKQREHERSGK